MNWKCVFIGGLVFWLVTTILGMFVTGFFIHGNILDPAYKANAEFWIPELAQDPPDMAALMPRWLSAALINSLLLAGVYSVVRGSFDGSGWKRGLKYGICLGIFGVTFFIGYSGVFNLPMEIWTWWGIDHFILSLSGGAAMGWAAAKWADA